MADAQPNMTEDDSGENVLESLDSATFKQDQAPAEPATPPAEPAPPPSQDKELPTIDEAAATQGQKPLPTINEAAADFDAKEHPTVQKAFINRMTATTPTELTEAQRVWAQNSYLGDVFKQFGVGYIKDYQQEMKLDPETIESIKNIGAWKGVTEGDDAINKSFMDGTVIPAVKNLYESTRQTYVTPVILGGTNIVNNLGIALPSALFSGAMQAAEQIAKETGTGDALPAALEYFATTAEGLGAVEFGVPKRAIPEPVLRANASGAFAGEGVFSGVKDPTSEQAKSMRDAASVLPAEAEAAPAKTIHEVARDIAPDTFKEFDDLSARREVLGNWLRRFSQERQDAAEANAPHNAEIEDLQAKLEDANPRKAKIYQARLEELTAKNDAWIAEAIKEDTPDIAGTRAKYQEIDYRMRDMAPDVSSAYREAESRMPPKVEEAEAAAQPEKEPAMAETPKEEAAPGKSLEDQHASIIADVIQKMTEVGRPSDEASAAAELIASHYRAVSDMGWAKGTPEEIYQAHAAEIKAGQGRARARVLTQPEGKTLAQKAKGKIRLGIDGAKNIISLFKTADSSTFIHEMGHHWLDEMMKFAEDAEAPQSIKDHAATVNEWLGVKEGEEISTRQHEKFARGFERYMMEGVAPSSKLADVFYKFKTWLTKIYQTVDRLKSPITDNIRDVFDRLLVSTPEKVVVAPDHPAGEKLAAVHEAEVAKTPAADAHKVADNIEKEIDSTIKQHKPEIEDAIKSAETGSVAETPPGNTEPSEESKSPAAGPGAVQEPPEVAASSRAAPPEGATARAGETEQSGVGGAKPTAEAAGGTGEPRGSDEVLGEPESEYVDKAGNIRLDNLNAADDVKNVLRDLAAQHDDFAAARGGVITVSQRSKMADSLGLTIHQFDPKQLEGVSPSVAADAMQKLTFQATDAVANVGKKFAENGSEENWVKYLQAKQRLLLIADTFSKITAEAGRTLKVFDKAQMKFTEDVTALLQNQSGKDLFQMQKEAKLVSSLDTGAKRARMLQASRKASYGDMILEYWINGLISGPATHMTYATGNTLLSLWRAVPETAAAAGIAKLHELAGHESSGITIGEVGAKLKGAAKGLPTAISATGSALKTGVTTLLPGEEPWTLPFQTQTTSPVRGVVIPNKNISWKELGEQTYGAVKGMRDAFIATGTLIKNGVEGAPLFEVKRSALGAIPDIAVRGVTVPVGNTVRVPGTSVAAIHSFFRTVNYSMEKSAGAYRTAMKEKLDGLEFANRVADGEMNPTESQMKDYRFKSTEATLMARGGDFTQKLSALTNYTANLPVLGSTKPFKFIDPFVHISSNVIDQTLAQRTPLGLLSEDIRNDLMGRNGAEARDMAQARMLVGTAFGITAAGLAAEGLMTGSGPSNAKERGIWIASGMQPHSIRVGDTWYDIHRLGPLGLLFSVGADMYSVAHAMSTEDAKTVATLLAHAVAQNVLDESFMRGPSELILAATDSERYGPQYIKNFVSSFVPFSVGMSQITRATDPYSRQTRSVMDAIKAKIPWESQSLMPRRDVWGEPVRNRDVFGIPGLSSIYETKINNDPVNRALLSVGIYPGVPGRSIRGVQLNDQQYDDYSRIAGRLTKQRLDNVVAQPGFTQMPAGHQVDFMRKIISSSREAARKATMMQYPDIMEQARERKMKILTGKK